MGTLACCLVVVGGTNYSFLSVSLAAGAHVSHTAASSIGAGLAAGFLHTLCGPDHLAALTPLTIGRKNIVASMLGAIWGFGHAFGQFILGILFVCLKERFNSLTPMLAKWSGAIVAVTLMAIGGFGIIESLEDEEEQQESEPAPGTVPNADATGAVSVQRRSTLTTFTTGVVYGLQPDSLYVVIPALALPTKLAAVLYCTMFVLGTVAAMGGYAFFIGTTSNALCKDNAQRQRQLSRGASIVALLLGSVLLLSTFVHIPIISELL